MKWTAGNRDNVEDVREPIGRRGHAHGWPRARRPARRARPELGDGRRLPFARRSGCDLHRVPRSAPAPAPGGELRTTPEEEQLVDFVDAVMRDAQEMWQTKLGGTLPGDASGRLSRCDPVGVRLRAVGDRSLLLPGRPARLSRPGVLQRAARPVPRAGRLRAGLRARARARPSRAEAARHRSAGAAAAAGATRRKQNALSVRLELQADCFAGIWGNQAAQPGRAAQGKVELETGDLEEGLNAAASIGDDRIQRMSGARVAPDRFTHGSSEQRVTWFRRGFRAATSRRATRSSRSIGQVKLARISHDRHG